MDLTRRQAVLAGIGLMVTGCSSTKTVDIGRPDPWTVQSVEEFRRRPTPTGNTHYVEPAPAASPKAAMSSGVADLKIASRSSWTRRGPNLRKINRMNGINKITVHHEGWKTVYFSDTRTTASRIEVIRRSHTGHKGWGDIGYHYIVDRSGGVWEGRSIAYQGAHVRDHNEHNLGILVLGNFDKQKPTSAQLASLQEAIAAFQKAHKVRQNRVYTHQELVSTACPGRHLQSQIYGIRRRLA